MEFMHLRLSPIQTTLWNLLLLIILTNFSYAQTSNDYRSAGNGNWNQIASWQRYDGSNWVAAAAFPTSSSGVISIQKAHQITITANVTADQIVIDSGGTLVNQAALTLANSGFGNVELEINGTFIAQAGASISRINASYSPLIHVNNGGIYEHARNFTNGILNAENVSTVIWKDGSTCLISTDPSSFNASLKQNFYNLTFNWASAGAGRVMEGNRPDSVRGTMSVIATGGGTLSLSLANGSSSRSMFVNNLEISGGNFYVAGSSSSNTQELIVKGNFLQTGGNFQVCRTSNSGTYRATIDGNATFSSGTTIIKNNSSSGTIFANLTVRGNTTINGGTLNLNGDTGGSNVGRLFIKGDMSLISGGLVISRIISTDSSGIYFDSSINQTFTWTGATLDTTSSGLGKRFYFKTSGGPSGLNEVYNGSSLQATINGLQGIPSAGYSRWPVSGSLIKNVTIDNNAGVRITTRKTVNTLLTLQNGSFALDSTLTIANGGTIKRVSGTLDKAPIFSTNVDIIYGDGSVIGAITPSFEMPSSLSNELNNLTINNPAGVLLNESIAIKNTLSLDAGNLTIPTGKILAISSGNAIAGTSFGINKSIITASNIGTGALGFLRTGNISTSRTYPISNGTRYLPVTIAPSSTNDFNLNVFTGATEDGLVNGTPFSSKSDMVDAIWTINRTSGTGSTNITLNWDDALEGTNFSTAPDNLISISRYDGASWDPGVGANGNNTTNSVTRTGIVNFSPFIVWINNLLPLKFGNLTAIRKNKDIRVEWITYEESGVSHFDIQRSADGKNFLSVGKVNASGNNLPQNNYQWNDFSAPESSVFYRIKSIDEDGSFIYSNIVRVAGIKAIKNQVSVYPNPLKSGSPINIQLPNLKRGIYELCISDMLGRVLYKQAIKHTEGIVNISMNNLNYKPGMYQLILIGEGISEKTSFLVVQ
jgi:hypothetical protein